MHRRQWRLLQALGLLLLSPLMAIAGQKAYSLKELEEQDYYKALLDYRLARVELWRLAGGGVK